MEMKKLLKSWFAKWENGNFRDLPISEDFQHTSPFGTIDGKIQYLELVEANKDKFLGYRFEIHDEIIDNDKACVRYTAVQGDFKLEVSEWHYARDGLIGSIISHYHIGDIREDRQIDNYE